MQYYKFKIYALFVSFFTGRSKIILLRYLVIDEDNSEIIIKYQQVSLKIND